MKNSVMYKQAQYAVLNSEHICNSDKLQILRELFKREDIELCLEEAEEQKRVAQGV